MMLAMSLGGCVAGPQPSSVHRFDELRLGARGAAPETAPPPSAVPPAVRLPSKDDRVAAAPVLRPRVAAPLEPAPVLPVSLEAAASRVSAYLDQAGFALEQQQDGPGRLVSATRMGAPQAVQAEAVCGLEAMHRPDIASTELTVRLTPAPGGVQLEASARFVEVDTRLLSGTLARQTCRSRGVLEAAVRRAALAG